MKKSILILLFAIVMSIASFAQPSAPITDWECDGYTLGCWAPVGYEGYQWERSAVSGGTITGGYQHTNGYFITTANYSIYPGAATLLGRVRVKVKSNGVWSAWSPYTYDNVWQNPVPTPGYPQGTSDPECDDPTTYTSTAPYPAAHYEWEITGGSYTVVGLDYMPSITIRFTTCGGEYKIRCRVQNPCGYSSYTSWKYLDVNY